MRLLLGLLALSASPSAFAGDEDPVDVELRGVDVLKAGLREVSFVVQADVTRMRWPGVVLRGLDYELSVGEQVMASGEFDTEAIKLKKGRTQRVDVPVTLQTLSSLSSLGGAALSGKVEIRLQGELRTRVLFVPVAVPFRSTLVDVDLSPG